VTVGVAAADVDASAATDDQHGSHHNPSVLKKFRELTHRLPGRITAPNATEMKTAIAGQLVMVNDAPRGGYVVVQVASNAYQLALDDIDDVTVNPNPTELERKIGVNVVIFLRSNFVTATTQVQNLLPRPEVPLALDESAPSSLLAFKDVLENPLVDCAKSPLLDPLPASVAADLELRTKDWEDLNGLLFGGVGAGGGQCTIKTTCKTTTFALLGPPVCDRYDTDQCSNY